MNDLSRALISDAEWERSRGYIEKIAIDQHIRNVAAEVYRNAGRALGHLEHNPVTGGAIAGALAGGLAGAAPKHDKQGRSRARRFARGAAGGAIAGGSIGLLAGGAVRNLGRYGNDIAEEMGHIRGSAAGAPWRDVSHGELREAMRRSVTNPLSRAGHRVKANNASDVGNMERLRQSVIRLTREVRTLPADDTSRPAKLDALREAAEELRKKKGGRAGHMGLGQAALLLGGVSAGAGLASSKMQDKEAAWFTPALGAALSSGINYVKQNPQVLSRAVEYGLPVIGGLLGGTSGLNTASMFAPIAARAVGNFVPAQGQVQNGTRLGAALDGLQGWVTRQTQQGQQAQQGQQTSP